MYSAAVPDMTGGAGRLLDWAVAAAPLEGQPVSGDLHLVKPFAAGVLVAVVDGLGHGSEAATAARIAVATMERHVGGPLVTLVERCHQALLRTRGAAASLAYFMPQNNTITWLAVGNVEGVLFRARSDNEWAREGLLLRGGALGSRLPPLRVSVAPVAPGDVLVIATDGVHRGFTEGLPLDESPQRIADYILTRHGTRTDDALALVARYLGGER